MSKEVVPPQPQQADEMPTELPKIVLSEDPSDEALSLELEKMLKAAKRLEKHDKVTLLRVGYALILETQKNPKA